MNANCDRDLEFLLRLIIIVEPRIRTQWNIPALIWATSFLVLVIRLVCILILCHLWMRNWTKFEFLLCKTDILSSAYKCQHFKHFRDASELQFEFVPLQSKHPNYFCAKNLKLNLISRQSTFSLSILFHLMWFLIFDFMWISFRMRFFIWRNK